MPSAAGNNTTANRVGRVFYNTLFRRNSVFISGIFVAAFGLQAAYDIGFDRLWDNLNKGKQWEDVKHKFVQES
ncbi:qcr9 subunit 9 of the ubiquinol cytochrome-c reductase complex [Basidiobolus ranarum]|uniref:Complex III subunit 9 n=1 Tax=Basidiobolus ranarum TaxID=34480 RepID=A0ABR2X4G3_9FUNG